MKVIYKSDKACQSLLYRSLYLYNKILDDLRMFNPKKLSRYLNQYIKDFYPNNKIPKYETI